MNRNDRIFAHIDRRGLGLEIGPSYNPIAPKRAGFNVETVDHMDQAGLVAKYTGHGVDTSAIEKVDYVWQGQPLSELIGQEGRYDWIIASHVIEHVPDLVGFLGECRKLLKPTGTLSLAIPDKRYCFDYFRPLSSTGDALQAHLEKRSRHPAGWVFDYFSSASALDGAITWVAGTRGDVRHLHSLEEARNFFQLAQQTDAPYIDIHAWRFTPSSFRLIVHELQQLDLIDLAESCFFDSVGCEFYVSLKPGPAASQVDRRSLARQIQKELALAAI
ncbi:methyltransferase family protein [Pseudofulvimonas gallinarii]|jgi:2-polyprenyl-3-methyl-5-hydroxy-6-metoxy-1,4-benzoquinol methylase|uniref:Methyltransferase family protein n=2 Tax=Pseudofulvimonas gallinarii TaxID=634155 RepID=A0A4R3LJ77_9GAMM|nr:methyltransferase domain-containing protein [Pseudofulvimonas gallinarii]TCT00302.1 methyltransferase family protein [Pseudofulvimonas gallinarii]